MSLVYGMKLLSLHIYTAWLSPWEICHVVFSISLWYDRELVHFCNNNNHVLLTVFNSVLESCLMITNNKFSPTCLLWFQKLLSFPPPPLMVNNWCGVIYRHTDVGLTCLKQEMIYRNLITEELSCSKVTESTEIILVQLPKLLLLS